ncbi:class IIb bacteriocin, lactobin A/cerein 7B family [Psychrobium sp. nBUS_13]|uniref:class IIb bacteriocin, lactobin A/cerein 7B family n=1 Tax=Psychrobium sp. nBUS_13 TaxID=3395319 RepID=UPI003EB6B683
MRELNVNEIKDVNGGAFWMAAAAVVTSPVIGAAAATLAAGAVAYGTYKLLEAAFE